MDVPDNVNFLTFQEVLCRKLFADGDQVVFGDAELTQLALGLNLCSCEVAAHRLLTRFSFGCACTELNSCVAVTFVCRWSTT